MSVRGLMCDDQRSRRSCCLHADPPFDTARHRACGIRPLRLATSWGLTVWVPKILTTSFPEILATCRLTNSNRPTRTIDAWAAAQGLLTGPLPEATALIAHERR
jgi:hypothetical protein